MDWEARPYEPEHREDWDDLVSRSRARHVLFARSFMEYHADRFEDASLLLLRKGKLAALLPASRHGEEVVSHGGLTFGGLVSDADGTTVRIVDALGCALDHHRGSGARRLVYKAVPHIYHLTPAEEDLHAIVVHGGQLTRRDVSTAIPRGAPVRYSSERRRAVQRGLRENVDIGRSFDFDRFMALEREVLLTRHGTEPVHTPEEIRLLAERHPDEIKLYAAHDAAGEMLAGVLIFETPAVAHCQYIGASDYGRTLRAQDALFHSLIADVYADKRWFEFGISMEPADGSLNEGLVRNKEGFGGRAVMYDRYAIDL